MYMNLSHMVAIGKGIKPNTYFKVIFTIHTGVKEYGILHIAIFGTN